jgi:predicted Fe-Mo cluster-binding NifX family protein
MKIAIAHWQNRVSPVFDVSDRICLVEIENSKELRRGDVTLMGRDPFSRIKEVSKLGADVLICGAISNIFEEALVKANIRVIGFICGDLDVIVPAFLCGQLTDGRFFMPGWSGGQRRYHFRGGRGKPGIKITTKEV